MERASLIVPNVVVFPFGRRQGAAIDHSSSLRERTETAAALSRLRALTLLPPSREKIRRDVRLRAQKDSHRGEQPRAYRCRIPKRRNRIWTVQQQPIGFHHDSTAPVAHCARRGKNHSAYRESIPTRHAVAHIR